VRSSIGADSSIGGATPHSQGGGSEAAYSTSSHVTFLSAQPTFADTASIATERLAPVMSDSDDDETPRYTQVPPCPHALAPTWLAPSTAPAPHGRALRSALHSSRSWQLERSRSNARVPPQRSPPENPS
jgi:hypothetical protein